MKQNTHTSEAVLLYGSLASLHFASLRSGLDAIARRFGIDGGRTVASGTGDFVFRSQAITLTITVTNSALEPDRFHGADRPRAAVTNADEIARRIDKHRSAIVLRVEPDADPESRALANSVCEEVTQLIGHRTPAKLVFWSESGMIISGEEFRSSTGGHAPIRPRRVVRAASTAAQSQRVARPVLSAMRAPAAPAAAEDDRVVVPRPRNLASEVLKAIPVRPFARSLVAQGDEAPMFASRRKQSMLAVSVAFGLCAPGSIYLLLTDTAVALGLG